MTVDIYFILTVNLYHTIKNNQDENRIIVSINLEFNK
jgi:hypothetical protein